MALTITDISDPRAGQIQFDLGPYKAKIVGVTFDSSYDNTNGETVTPAMLGWQQIHWSVEMAPPWNGSTSDKALATVRIRASSGTGGITFRLFGFDGDDTGDPSAFSELLNAANVSAYIGYYMFLGH